jgi:hypothetical protein
MRAPVYRHIEGRSTIGGLSLNGFIALLGVALAAIQWLPLGSSLLAICGTYAALRLAASGRPPQFWQHLAVWRVRQLAAGGRLSAAARCRSPQFPFGPYQSRPSVR